MHRFGSIKQLILRSYEKKPQFGAFFKIDYDSASPKMGYRRHPLLQ